MPHIVIHRENANENYIEISSYTVRIAKINKGNDSTFIGDGGHLFTSGRTVNWDSHCKAMWKSLRKSRMALLRYPPVAPLGTYPATLLLTHAPQLQCCSMHNSWILWWATLLAWWDGDMQRFVKFTSGSFIRFFRQIKRGREGVLWVWLAVSQG